MIIVLNTTPPMPTIVQFSEIYAVMNSENSFEIPTQRSSGRSSFTIKGTGTLDASGSINISYVLEEVNDSKTYSCTATFTK